MAVFVGPELTSMVAFLTALPILILAAKKGFLMPKEVMTFDGVEKWGDQSWLSTQTVSQPQDKGMSPVKAWMPYVIISIILVLTRVGFFKIKPILTDEPLFCTLIIFLDLTRSTGILNSYGILVLCHLH